MKEVYLHTKKMSILIENYNINVKKFNHRKQI